MNADTLDEKVYRFFKKLGTRKEVHHKDLQWASGTRGYTARISYARKALKREGLVIPRAKVVRRKVRGKVIVDSYYRVERAK